jgi:hypothetical protein
MEEKNNLDIWTISNTTKMINLQKSRKRTIEEEFQPVLVRMTSESSNSADDYIHINKNQVFQKFLVSAL